MRRILRMKQVIEISGVSRSTIHRLQKKNEFVRKVNLGLRAVGYFEDELCKWLEERAAVSHKN